MKTLRWKERGSKNSKEIESDESRITLLMNEGGIDDPGLWFSGIKQQIASKLQGVSFSYSLHLDIHKIIIRSISSLGCKLFINYISRMDQNEISKEKLTQFWGAIVVNFSFRGKYYDSAQEVIDGIRLDCVKKQIDSQSFTRDDFEIIFSYFSGFVRDNYSFFNIYSVFDVYLRGFTQFDDFSKRITTFRNKIVTDSNRNNNDNLVYLAVRLKDDFGINKKSEGISFLRFYDLYRLVLRINDMSILPGDLNSLPRNNSLSIATIEFLSKMNFDCLAFKGCYDDRRCGPVRYLISSKRNNTFVDEEIFREVCSNISYFELLSIRSSTLKLLSKLPSDLTKDSRNIFDEIQQIKKVECNAIIKTYVTSFLEKVFYEITSSAFVSEADILLKMISQEIALRKSCSVFVLYKNASLNYQPYVKEWILKNTFEIVNSDFDFPGRITDNFYFEFFLQNLSGDIKKEFVKKSFCFAIDNNRPTTIKFLMPSAGVDQVCEALDYAYEAGKENFVNQIVRDSKNTNELNSNSI